MSPQDAARVFERFERAVSVRHYGGLGLGLYITRQIVEAHGGTISVDSRLGEGATFTVVLPVDGAAAGSTEAA
jgi:signal transduction histidine kinase